MVVEVWDMAGIRYECRWRSGEERVGSVFSAKDLNLQGYMFRHSSTALYFTTVFHARNTRRSSDIDCLCIRTADEEQAMDVN